MTEQLSSKEASPQVYPSVLQRIAALVFGYDYFISYAQLDGSRYANELMRALQLQGFVCFLDLQDYAKGDRWKTSGVWALKRTSVLLVVVTSGSLKSASVLWEVQTFVRGRKRVIPIDFDGTLDSDLTSPLRSTIGSDALRIKEQANTLNMGPSAETVCDITSAFEKTRQNVKRQRWLLSFLTILIALLAFSLIQWREADVRGIETNQQLAKVFWQSALRAQNGLDTTTEESRGHPLPAFTQQRLTPPSLV